MSTVPFFCILCGSALQTPSDCLDDSMQCPSCSHHVPVPPSVKGSRHLASYPLVLPPEVLDLLVKFHCTACSCVLYADARYEGRDVICSKCSARTGIPRWSNVPGRAGSAEGGQTERMRPMKSPARAEPPTLSVEEIDFLRGMDSRKPEAAA